MKFRVLILITACLLAASHFSFASALDLQKGAALRGHAMSQSDSTPSSIRWGEVVTDGYHDAILMTHEEAEAYCRHAGGRLPSPREYAQLAESRGAHGIIETAFPGISYRDPRVQAEIDKIAKDGWYNIVYRRNHAGEVAIDFYYDGTDYQRPSGYVNAWDLWTSAVDPSSSSQAVFYSFNPAGAGIAGPAGQIKGKFDIAPLSETAVRCVR